MAAEARPGHLREDRRAGKAQAGEPRLHEPGRVLRLALLALDIVEAILDGRQQEGLRLEDLLEGFPVEWEAQYVDPQS